MMQKGFTALPVPVTNFEEYFITSELQILDISVGKLMLPLLCALKF